MVFIRKQENFICEHCGHPVKGNGYTNHCPQCLYSKHVDNDPGDRAANCGGLMPPVQAYLKKNERILVHRCQRCGHEKINKCAENDNFELIVKLMEEIAKNC